MPEQSTKAKGRAGPKITVPKGLDEVVFTCRAPKGEIDLPALSKHFEKLPSMFAVSEKGAVRGRAASDSHLSSHHAHFEASEIEGERVFISYSLHSGKTPDEAKVQLTVTELPDLVARFITTPERRLSGVVSSNYVLLRKEWESTIPLPFDVPGSLGQSAGAPQIAGVDFNFRDTKQQPISRAFVSTYTDEIVVRILSHVTATFGSGLNQDLINEAARHLPVFVQPVKGRSSGD